MNAQCHRCISYFTDKTYHNNFLIAILCFALATKSFLIYIVAQMQRCIVHDGIFFDNTN